MKERDLILMKSLIESYVREGQPVGSKSLLRMSHLSISPATARNIMADLERQGLLLSPHTSAGRIPTTQGLRIFVDRLVQVKTVHPSILTELKFHLNPSQETGTILNKASRLLSDLTKMVSLVQTPSKPFQRLQQIDFVPLSDRKLLVVMVLQDNEIQNRIIDVEKDFTRDELNEMANYLNHKIVGQDLSAVRDEVLKQMKNDRAEMNEMTEAAIALAEQGLIRDEKDALQEKEFHLSGQGNLITMASHGQLPNLESIFNAFKQKQQVVSILERSMAAKGVKIFIGEECGEQSFKDCSIVTAPYKLNGQSIGVLAVVGPTRMEYDRVIPIVDVTAKLLSSSLTYKAGQEKH
ncbi:MAG: heat-inducible transcriptional repressor HrcA [Gammaproteobacteria bacterium]|nr:heat-inducible transcriptional repressor HrcA [Gammaproteobacteria bacterium]MDH5629429.1 heat-inducible transcriptional repressor HrcA [Gammaproteobacteria bacterium]